MSESKPVKSIKRGDISKGIATWQTYHCPDCNNPIPKIYGVNLVRCVKCGTTVSFEKVKD